MISFMTNPHLLGFDVRIFLNDFHLCDNLSSVRFGDNFNRSGVSLRGRDDLFSDNGASLAVLHHQNVRWHLRLFNRNLIWLCGVEFNDAILSGHDVNARRQVGHLFGVHFDNAFGIRHENRSGADFLNSVSRHDLVGEQFSVGTVGLHCRVAERPLDHVAATSKFVLLGLGGPILVTGRVKFVSLWPDGVGVAVGQVESSFT